MGTVQVLVFLCYMVAQCALLHLHIDCKPIVALSEKKGNFLDLELKFLDCRYRLSLSLKLYTNGIIFG